MAVWIDKNANEYNNSQYSDGQIEQEMLEMARSGKVDWYTDNRWPVVYHFSHLRHNILNWYPFKPDAKILEIGAGCGALTGFLCEKASHITALELTRIRARINYERHKQYPQLEVVVADFNDYETEEKYDYIIINGVLEYAAYMLKTPDPYVAFLEKAKSFLGENGRILLAIENRFGLKYFAGSREDHTGLFFSGINNYRSNERVRTFTRHEIQKTVSSAGLNILRFYYPYPDYKFPEEIFTDESINRRTPITVDMHMDLPWETFFDIGSVQRTLVNEGIAERFCNSFLIEIARPGVKAEQCADYIKISANRKPQYRLVTMLDYSKKVSIKKPLTLEACGHILSMQQHAREKKGIIINADAHMEGNALVSELLELEKASDYVEQLYQKNINAALEWVRTFGNHLLMDVELDDQPEDRRFNAVFGDTSPTKRLHWAKRTNLDLTLDNIFIDAEKFIIIDYEWEQEFALPIEYCLWRTVKALDEKIHTEVFRVLLDEFAIDSQLEKVFSEWELQFAMNYVGMKPLSTLTQPNYHFFDNILVHGLDYEQLRKNNKRLNEIYNQVVSENKNLVANNNKYLAENEQLTAEVDYAHSKPVRWFVNRIILKRK